MKGKDICLDIDSTTSKIKQNMFSSGRNEMFLGWALKKDRKKFSFFLEGKSLP